MWKTVLRVIKTLRPDRIIHTGDIMDYPQPSRWTRGTREEFEGSVYETSKKAVVDIIEPLRAVYSGPIGIHEGNHDARPRIYVEKYAPALASDDRFDIATLLEFEQHGIERLPDFHQIAPGWLTTHGHLGGIRLAQTAGNTALNAARRIGASIIMGHTHRAGLCSFTMGLGGKTHTLTGVEVGHIMDPKKVTYLKGATGNWQQGIAVVDVDGKTVTPQLVPVANRKMVFNGKVYTV